MEKRDCLGQICFLKVDFLQKVYDIDAHALIKGKRPYLILELTYGSSPQLFAVPFQTSVKPSLQEAFWDKMPRRLETMSNMEYGLLYCSMIPICEDAVLRKKESEKEITHDEKKAELLFKNLIYRAPDALPAKARESFEFLKKRAMKDGMSCFGDFSVNKAYAKISKELHIELIKFKDINLAAILKKAQNYLTNHYGATQRNKEHPERRAFVDMPKHYTDIAKLIGIVNEYTKN